MDLKKKKFELVVNGRKLQLDISGIAGRTNSAIMASYGESTVLVTIVMGNEDRNNIDYLPLSVDYEEKFYAAGKIIGSRFIRREGRPSDEAILSGRLIDRAIRPLFDHRIRRDIQIVVTVLSYDGENDPDLIALNAVSAALSISDIPWNGPVAGVKVAKINGQLIVNPLFSELAAGGTKFETFAAGSRDKINMIELSGDDASEEEIIEAFKLASREIERILDFQTNIVKEVSQKKVDMKFEEPSDALKETVRGFLETKLEKAVYVKDKPDRENNVEKLKKDLVYHLSESGFSGADLNVANHIFDEEVDFIVHQKILKENLRPDGRKLDELRELYGEISLLPRVHGSSLFVRGNTQALAIVTLAPPGAEQLVETMEQSGKRRFMLHYNFPAFSVGETRSNRGPGRRDIGHGALAEKTMMPIIPSKEDFPYTIRVVSEILSSNGSSSMATVCASSMALMDAGVPIKKPAAGIAMGLMSDNNGNYKILTDIQGPEDHYGDMDLKVAGTKDGVNAIQMDVKIEGVTFEILGKALAQAKKARLEILEVINKVIAKPKENLSKFAPRVLVLNIDPSRIGEIIGPGGKVINGIVNRTGATIDIDQSGTVYVAGSKEAAEIAAEEIKSIFKEFEIGEIIEGPVVKILDFGAIVDLGGGRDGMIHVSELKNGFVENVADVVKVGDNIKAKVVRTENGRIALSIKQLKP